MDTIAGLATPAGPGLRAVLRLSGLRAVAVAGRFLAGGLGRVAPFSRIEAGCKLPGGARLPPRKRSGFAPGASGRLCLENSTLREGSPDVGPNRCTHSDLSDERDR